MKNRSVGIDVGGTFAKLGLVDPSGEVIEAIQIPTLPAKGPADFLRRAEGVLRNWSFSSIGLGLAGGVDPDTGALLFVPNLKGWTGFSFRRALERAYAVPVAVDNDANVAVWGGYKAALGGKGRTIVGLTLGTGVGGGLIVDGELHRGATGSAGEIGHMTLQLDGPRCACGRRGCLEAYAGTAGILRAAKRHMKKLPSPLTPKAVADAALAGDKGAKAVWAETGERLGQGIASLVLLLNPDAVLILGGVAKAGKLIMDPLRRVLADQPFREPFRGLELSAPADRDWGVVGAALLSRERR